jgi:signal peptidase I
MKSSVVVLAILFGFISGMLTPSLMPQVYFPQSTVAPDRASPQDWVSADQIKVYQDRVVLEIPNARWASFADSKSMDPLLDKGAHGIQITPQSPETLAVGDIVSYDYHGRKIIHRIMEINQDEQGYYFILKGDNNPLPDPEKVRWDQIERVLVAVVY